MAERGSDPHRHPTAEQAIVAQAGHRGDWSLLYTGYDPDQEGLREALCATGNGYFGTRGAAPEASADGVHYPGTYAAGAFNRLVTEIAGREVSNEDMVNLPNWLPLSFRIEGGEWFDPREVQLLSYEQELDLRRGVLLRRVRFCDEENRHTHFAQRRFVSMAARNVAALETTIEAENWSGRIEIRSGLDGGVENSGIERYRELASRHLVEVAGDGLDEETLGLRCRTSQSRIGIALAARTRAHCRGELRAPEHEVLREGDAIFHRLSCELERGVPCTVEKVAVLFTSREPGISEPGEAARGAIAEAGSFDDLLAPHVVRWGQLWARAGLEIAGGERERFVLNLHIFHLLQTVSEHTAELDAGVPARGLHGEAYRGHIFWDEVFVLPYLSFRLPELVRSLLAYRHRRLPAARRAAAAAGLRGAMFPWQSGSDGREESQVVHLNPESGRWIPDHSHLQRHIDIAIAYNFIHYHRVSGDLSFLIAEGAEVVLEIARFLADLATYDRARDRYVIRRVMGPDEFHDAYPDAAEPGLDNNAYTNLMTVWTLWRALELLEQVPERRRAELRDRLRLSRDELDRWLEVSNRMFIPFHDNGIISQFEGYEALEELDWEGYRGRYGDIHRLDRILEAEGDTPNRYKASKQADVLMIFYLLGAAEVEALLHRLGYPYEEELIPRNTDYYAARTAHGSTLSRLVHSWVLAREDRPRSWALLREAMESDVADVQGGTTREGIHLGAMAGTVDLIQRGYLGLDPRGDCLALNPVLPEELRGVSLSLRYREHWSVDVSVRDGKLRVVVPPSEARPIAIELDGERNVVAPGQTFERRLG